MIEMISRDELKARLDRRDDFILVEVLQPAAYIQAHLPNAINLPSDRVRELAPTLLPDRSASIVVYCSGPTWHASERVARELATMGYTNVLEYAGGKKDWIEAGLPVESEVG